MSRVVIVGGGPAGMMAAIRAAENGHQVILLEKNEKLGKKLFITGKGRCNLTNDCDPEDLLSNVMTNSRFLYSAVCSFDNKNVTEFFNRNGCRTKVERGGRVFPVSDHSSDVIRTLQNELQKNHVDVRLHTKVSHILTGEYHPSEPASKKQRYASRVCGVLLSDQTEIPADAVLIATGGNSYQATGSTGDGYRFASECGHTVTEIVPSLVPFYAAEPYIRQLQGLSLKNVNVRIFDGQKLIYEEFGEMLFTHFGVSGPVILSASAAIKDNLRKKKLSLRIQLKPALSKEQLDRRLLRDFQGASRKQFKNALGGLLPAKMIPVFIALSNISPEKRVNEITKEERAQMIALLDEFPVTLCGVRGFEEAIITRGGVATKEINPSTMESKYVKNLFFCGEVLDVDAMTGGYNLQIAWSTGYLAGDSIE